MTVVERSIEFKGSDQAPLVPIRCRGNGEQMGWGTGKPLVRVYCSPSCAFDGPLEADEERNDCIREAVAAGWTTGRTALNWDLTRQRVNQVLKGRRDRL